jgi:phosphomannomutase
MTAKTAFSGDRSAREQKILQRQPGDESAVSKSPGLNTTDGFKFSLEDGGWLLVRFSGTEPILRVYTETTHKERVQDILQDGLRIAGLE